MGISSRFHRWRLADWLAAGFASFVLWGPVENSAWSDADPGQETAPRVASRSSSSSTSTSTSRTTAPASSSLTEPADLVAQAKAAIADCQARYVKVVDYTCTFVKRERIGKTLTHPHVMDMKARTNPTSIYFKFRTPNKGREAIFVSGRNSGKVVAHDVGIGKFLAGTMKLDPHGTMAMEDCRHPITEAGIGHLIETVAGHWNAELSRGESLVSIKPEMRIGAHACTMIETIHPAKNPHLLFHKVRLYIDQEHGLPIRFEAYDWPAQPGGPAELVEEYTYLDLKINLGLGEHDFDPANRAYSFGRF